MRFDINEFTRPPTIEIAKGSTYISDERAEQRVAAAYHEAAHFVAGVACQGAIFGVAILPMQGNYVLYSARSRFSTIGAVRVEVESEWHNSVVDLVGRAIEEKRGGSDRVWQDDHLRAMERPHYDEALAEARRFVKRYFSLIELCATAFLMLANKASGEIHPGRLRKLIDYLRPKVLKYASKPAAI